MCRLCFNTPSSSSGGIRYYISAAYLTRSERRHMPIDIEVDDTSLVEAVHLVLWASESDSDLCKKWLMSECKRVVEYFIALFWICDKLSPSMCYTRDDDRWRRVILREITYTAASKWPIRLESQLNVIHQSQAKYFAQHLDENGCIIDSDLETHFFQCFRMHFWIGIIDCNKTIRLQIYEST